MLYCHYGDSPANYSDFDSDQPLQLSGKSMIYIMLGELVANLTALEYALQNFAVLSCHMIIYIMLGELVAILMAPAYVLQNLAVLPCHMIIYIVM